MKNIILFILLLCAIINSNAQTDKIKSIDYIRSQNNNYKKIYWEQSNLINYENFKDTLINKEFFYKEVDRKATLKFNSNKTINTILTKSLSKTEMSKLLSFKGLGLTIIFNKQGKAENITFAFPKDFKISATQLEEIEKSLKKNLIVTILNMDQTKKYIAWTLMVRFSTILDGSYPY